MKKIISSSTRFVLSCVTASFFSITSAHAQAVWKDAGAGNWSVGGNWTGGTGTGGIPSPSDNVYFLDTGAAFVNTMDQNFTINSLTYAPDITGSVINTTINNGLTLSITGSASNATLTVGNANSAANTSATTVEAKITGGNNLSAMSLNSSGYLSVVQGNGTSGAHMATLDPSGVPTLTATLGQILVGTSTQASPPNRPSGTLFLAQTNNITLIGTGTGSGAALQVQYSEVNANGSTLSLIELGQVNTLNVDNVEIGGAKGEGTIEFNPAFSSPTLNLFNEDGTDPVVAFVVGDDSYVTSGNSATGVADFSLGTINASVATVLVAEGNPGPGTGTSTGTINIGAGTFAVTGNMIVGDQISTAGNGGVTGTVNVGAGVGGGTLSVAGTLTLAQTNAGATATANGTVNVESLATLAANSIVAGATATANSLSTLTINGTLWLTNTAGSLTQPIRNFNPGGAILNLPALNSGAAIVCATNTPGGSSVINVTSIPAIGVYPANFPLISYQQGDSGGNNFTLGTVPAGSPSYVATLLDTGNGTVTLHLANGPVTVLSLLWEGTNGNNWDVASTFNWLFPGVGGVTHQFVNGDSPIFDDASATTNVNLVQALSPASVTVGNTNDHIYTFEGPGYVSGSSLLTKQGSGTLVLDHSGVDNYTAVTITGGALQLGNDDTNGAINTLNIADGGALVDDSTGALALNGNMSGTGTISQVGGGSLTLAGSNSYSGSTLLTNGTLIINGTSSGAGAITASAGTVLAGIGSVDGAISVGGNFNPGPIGGNGGVFTGSNGLVLSNGATITVGLSATDPSSVGSSTAAITGSLTAHNNQITVNFNAPPNQNDYPVITYTPGSLSGSFNPTVLGTHYAATVDSTSTPGTVFVDITGSSGYVLDWASTSSSAWDSATENWVIDGTSTPSLFYAGDEVVLNDAPGVITTITIAAGTTVTPLLISNNSANNAFTISGAGSIGGSASIIKTNTSTLNISTANSFTGTVTIGQGTLQTGNRLAFGATTGVTVYPGATLDVDGQNLGTIPISVQGMGVNGNGAIISSGGGNNNNFNDITLLGDTAFGGNLELNDSGGAANLSSDGNAYSIFKVGSGTFTIANLTTFDDGISNIDIQDGELAFSGVPPDMGDPLATNIVELNAELEFQNGVATWSKNFIFNGNGSTPTVEVDGGGFPTLNGNVQLFGGCIFNVTGIALAITGPISGTGSLIKEGNSEMTLDTNETYTGDTTITTGTLQLTGYGSISDSAVIAVDSGTVLDVSQLNTPTLTLASSQTLEGSGVVYGSLVAGAGSVVTPGPSTGTLTVTNSIVLSGATSMSLDQQNATNTVLTSTYSSITYGGILDLAYLNNPPAVGNSYKLFQAASYSGSFSSISPATPAPGEAWDTSVLATTGVLRVAGVPHITSITRSAGNVTVSGTNGTPSGTYYVLTSTNIALPLTSWTRLATNSYTGGGDFSFTTTDSVVQQYFVLLAP